MSSRTLIRHEPFLLLLYLMGVVTLLLLGIGIKTDDYSYLTIISIFDLGFLLVHVFLRQNIIAVITDEGFSLGGPRVTRWEEIVSWSYAPAGKRFQNRLIIITDIGNKFEIRGFRYLKVRKLMLRYAREKRTGFSLAIKKTHPGGMRRAV